LLQIGATYLLTAATNAGAGFAFTNWTGGTNGTAAVLTNGTALQFVMQSNLVLQANFVDVQPPVVAITSPVSGQRWSNAVFTATGTAGDNVQVSNVAIQLNGGAWSNALAANNWTNWTAALNLVPGTNTLWAYAVDTSGNHSSTGSVSMDFVVTNQLLVRATGLGTIAPDYSNAWLEIGRNYSMTATAMKGGFVFAHWVVSTNWQVGVTNGAATLPFTMVSNLTLQVNFNDIIKPFVTISSPTSGQQVTNVLMTVVGTSSDNWQVSGVWYQLNGGGWTLASSTNSYNNWTAVVALSAGTNTVNAYAMDPAGDFSATNSVSFVSGSAFQLKLTFTSSQPLAAGGFGFSVQLPVGQSGHIEGSTNLINWTTLTNFNGSNSTFNFLDPAATNYKGRFYRAVLP
jgi:hypothetical protein